MIATIYHSCRERRPFLTSLRGNPSVAILEIVTPDDEGDMLAGCAMQRQVTLSNDVRTGEHSARDIRLACDAIIAFVNEVDFAQSALQLLVSCERNPMYAAAVCQFIAALYGRPIASGPSVVIEPGQCDILTDLLHDAYLENSLAA